MDASTQSTPVRTTPTLSDPTDPTVLVVFGATGDLMERKIVPSLYYLFEKGHLPERFRVIGVARRDIGDHGLRGAVSDTVKRHAARPPKPADLESFARLFTYQRGEFHDMAAYGQLVDDLNAIDDEWGVCSNKLFYLAVPPSSYRTIFESLAGSGLTASCAETGPGGRPGGWTRVIVEKPFGRDAKTAQELDELLGTLFEERQIYRIDHYLAKEMLQGIMNFRFSNNLLEPSWDARAIERIEINLLETLGVEGRGAFYDGVGALRDIGQNHLLQMLALITMQQPVAMDADSIRASRYAALRGLRRMTSDQVTRHTFRAQYEGYRDAEGVAADSSTETFFRVATQLHAPGWEGVPVILQGGKSVATVRKDIVVTFRHPHPCLCDGVHAQNKVTFTLEPMESIRIRFWTKKPGFADSLEGRDFNFFLYEKEEKAQYVEEYAKLLADAIAGDQTLFVSTREVKAMWEFIDPIVEAWEAGAAPLERYTPMADEVVEAAESAVGIPGPDDGFTREIGVVGLGKMGANLARNLMDHGWRVVGYNRTSRVSMEMEPDGLVAAYALKDVIAKLSPPRTVWLMVPAGKPVDEVLFGPEGLAMYLRPGDTVIDGGNSHHTSDAPRAEKLAKLGVGFIDVGTSGGPGGARHGACLMIGGERRFCDRLEPLWRDVSVEGGYRLFPHVGAGHFVKMVHNGIEYGMMQAIAEGFAILKDAEYTLDLTDVAEVYDHGSVVESRLMGWLQRAFELHGEGLETVSGTVAHTGEGAWTVEAAERERVEAKVIAEALAFRVRSETQPSYMGQVLSALREQFGQHDVRE
jgi:glucose-6-phosphate 1-dehydrogenase